MDSWAENDKLYPSKNGETPNKSEPLPEMQAAGFVPTYIDSGGNLVAGDGMTAQHFNYIFCDLYRKYRDILARVEALENA